MRARLLRALAKVLPRSRAARAVGIAVLAGAVAGVLLVPKLPMLGAEDESSCPRRRCWVKHYRRVMVR